MEKIKGKKLVLLLMLLLSGNGFFAQASAQDYRIPENTPAHIRDAVLSSSRSEEDIARDAGRLPAEVLTLSDLNQGDSIIELSSLGEYYSKMLVVAVGPYGNVDMYDLPVWEQFGAGENGSAFAEANANAQHQLADYDEADYPSGVDAVYNINSYHDLQEAGIDTAVMNDRLYRALKPGGKYIVIDHRAADGSGWRDSASLHRIDKEQIISEVEAAGFELVLDSPLLAHSEDDRTGAVFTMSGATDRAVLVFRKPI